jgi:hypothetical protein
LRQSHHESRGPSIREALERARSAITPPRSRLAEARREIDSALDRLCQHAGYDPGLLTADDFLACGCPECKFILQVNATLDALSKGALKRPATLNALVEDLLASSR